MAETREESERGVGFWREAAEEELWKALQDDPAGPGPAEARAALLNPFLSARVLGELLAIRTLRSSYRWRRDLVRCRLLPVAEGMSLVPGLYWRDLARCGTEVTVQPALRRQADRILLQRLPRLALGERIALARICGPTIVAALRRDPNPRVFGALLENPRLTEGALLPLLTGGSVAPSSLRILAENRRWGARMEIRRAVARHPNAPTEVALRILPSLPKADLRSIRRDPRAPQPVRRRCAVLLGEDPGG